MPDDPLRVIVTIEATGGARPLVAGDKTRVQVDIEMPAAHVSADNAAAIVTGAADAASSLARLLGLDPSQVPTRIEQAPPADDGTQCVACGMRATHAIHSPMNTDPGAHPFRWPA